MFKAKLDDTNDFKKCLQVISNLISEGKFQASGKGLRLKAADPAMAAMVDFQMEKQAFEEYQAEDEEIAINLEKLYSIVRRVKSSDILSLELNDSQLVIKMENGSQRKFSLPLLNIDEEVPETEGLDFNTRADLRSSLFSEGIKDASIISDSITVTAEDKELKIVAEGNNSGSEFKIDSNSEGVMEMETNGKAESMYSLDYLKKIMKAEKLSDTVKLQLGNEFPMRVDFEVPDKLQLGFILAPRIEED
ncbi:MAG: proliferating cell nuclear antigen (pcna) [Candidatus Nanohaloarchaea archaeon]|nr:proliferating cell nuclear antigen (pcna) [Candidatus Nanohaloarchaea archaeon]